MVYVKNEAIYAKAPIPKSCNTGQSQLFVSRLTMASVLTHCMARHKKPIMTLQQGN